MPVLYSNRPTMKAHRFLFAKTSSRCCQAKALVVQSRAGGFVSQNCLKCGKPEYINEHALPDVDCDFCGRRLAVERVDGQNYFYVCRQCNRNWKLGDSVPSWSDLFRYFGLAVDSDFPGR
jgi:ribosomal protein S27E